MCVHSWVQCTIELALFDIEYLFLKARSKSAGETINVVCRDPQDETFQTDHKIDIDKIKVIKNKDHSDLIELDENTHVKMKYPDISFFEAGVQLDDVENMSKVLSRCIAQIIVGEDVYSRQDMSEEELTEWVDGLTQVQYRKLIGFFETMPKLRHEIKILNTNTDKHFTIVLEGLADFF